MERTNFSQTNSQTVYPSQQEFRQDLCSLCMPTSSMCIGFGVGYFYGAATGVLAGALTTIGLPLAYFLCCTNPCYEGPRRSTGSI